MSHEVACSEAIKSLQFAKSIVLVTGSYMFRDYGPLPPFKGSEVWALWLGFRVWGLGRGFRGYMRDVPGVDPFFNCPY